MCFFSPNTDALTPLRSHATPDRAPDHLVDGTPAALRDYLISLLGSTAVRSRVSDLVKYATDASPYKQQSIQAKTLRFLPCCNKSWGNFRSPS
jgi:D-lactate dehydrogenase